MANHLEVKRYYFKHDHGNVILFGTKNIYHISALQENNNFNSFNFLMGDNSVDMIPLALDNGEPNSTMANQIAYSPKETILEGYFCTQMVPSSSETKWCSMILC